MTTREGQQRGRASVSALLNPSRGLEGTPMDVPGMLKCPSFIRKRNKNKCFPSSNWSESRKVPCLGQQDSGGGESPSSVGPFSCVLLLGPC